MSEDFPKMTCLLKRSDHMDFLSSIEKDFYDYELDKIVSGIFSGIKIKLLILALMMKT